MQCPLHSTDKISSSVINDFKHDQTIITPRSYHSSQLSNDVKHVEVTTMKVMHPSMNFMCGFVLNMKLRVRSLYL